MSTPNEARDGAIIAGFRDGKRYCDPGEEYGVSGQRITQIIWKEVRRLDLYEQLPESPTHDRQSRADLRS
jgi:hypothetical protein